MSCNLSSSRLTHHLHVTAALLTSNLAFFCDQLTCSGKCEI